MATDTAAGDTGEASAPGGAELRATRRSPPFRDELFEHDGTPRPVRGRALERLEQPRPRRPRRRRAPPRRDLHAAGDHVRDDRRGRARARAPVPARPRAAVLTGPEWTVVKRGLAQRIRALNHFVDDVYHGREIVRDGHRARGSSSPAARSFARAVHGIRPPGGVYCHVAGCDLVRDTDGTWQVLEDNVRTPSGISYVLENRVAMARLVPGLFSAYRVRAGRPLPAAAARRAALGRAVDRQRGDGRRLDPGPAQLGLLRARLPRAPDGRRAGRGLRPRRARRGPLHAHDARACAACTRSTAGSTTTSSTRSSSAPTRCSACRASCAPTAPAPSRSPTRSAPASPTTRPSTTTSREMIRYYLGEEPLLENVETYLLTDPETARARARPHRTSSSSSRRASPAARACSIGPAATRRGARAMPKATVRANPERWIAQEVVNLSTVPTAGPRRAARAAPRRPAPVRRLRRADRHRPRRPDARRAEEGSMIVNSSRGGGSKDTWVLEDGRGRRARPGRRFPSRCRRRCRTCATAAGPARRSSSNSSSATDAGADRPRALLAGPQPRARRVHRARRRRRLPARAPGPAATPRRASSSAGRSCVAMLDAERAPPATHDEALQRLTLDADAPGSMRASVERAREGARTVRDVISAEMWEAINTTALTCATRTRRDWLAPGGPHLACRVRQGARRARSAGSATARCCATRRKAFFSRRAATSSPPTWCCGCCASRFAGDGEQPPAAGPALALLQAVGGFQAFRRAVPAPPNARPGRALPAVRARLPGQRRRVRRLAARGARWRPTRARATPSRCCASAAWRPTSSSSAAHCRTTPRSARPARSCSRSSRASTRTSPSATSPERRPRAAARLAV